MSIEFKNVDCGYALIPVVCGVTFSLGAGEFLCLLGPNGSGKTALLKTLAGILPLLGGSLALDGRPWHTWTPAERAARIAYVPQAHAPLFAFRVLDVVAMGRTARWPVWSGPSRSDWHAAHRALDAVGMSGFAERRYTELSGGERQMVMVARALAQEARFLVLDEPASSLDFGNQVRVLQTLRRLSREGFGVLMATHHPEHALRCATRVAVVRDGALETPAAPADALTAAHLESIYRVPFFVSELTDRAGQSFPVCAPHIE